MSSDPLFAGFTVAPGQDRTKQPMLLGGEPHDCKLSAADTDGAMCVFETTAHGGGPEHAHRDQDEWLYIVEGDFEFRVGKEHFIAHPGQFVFIPRTVPHVWRAATADPGKIINAYQPAGKIEAFFHELAKYKDPPVHEALGLQGLRQLFHSHDMDLLGPPLGWTGPLE